MNEKSKCRTRKKLYTGVVFFLLQKRTCEGGTELGCCSYSIGLGERPGAFLVGAQRARIFRRPQFGYHDAARMQSAGVFLLRRPGDGMD